MSTASVLELDSITKRFSGVAALANASLNLRAGSVHALLGENGAGKTTLMRVAFGMESPDAGTVRVRGSAVRINTPREAIALGIGMVHQHFTLVPAMTVAENIALGGTGRFDAASISERTRVIARSTGFAIEPEARVGDLSVSEQQRLELVKALSRDSQILIFDEPTAVLPPTEAAEFLQHIRQLANTGRSVILITHKLREALSVADDITVLRRGETILAKPREAVDEEQLIEAMLGQRDFRSARATHSGAVRETVIAARNVSIADARNTTRVRDATFDIRGGEIVGIAAVEGSGHRELLRALARRAAISSGSLTLPPAVGFVPDDRHRDGLVLDMSLAENIALRGAGARTGRIRWRDITDATQTIVDSFDVRAAGAHVRASTLSGGNQQKFILGRELQGPPPALVIENPTRGLDVRAAAYVEAQLLQARLRGVAIVMYSTDIDEVVALADRMLVMFSGLVREVAVDADTIGRAMLGALE